MAEPIPAPAPAPQKKKPWLSKTLWLNSFALVAAWLIGFGKDEAASFLSETNMIMVLSVVNLFLRMVTKDKIGLED